MMPPGSSGSVAEDLRRYNADQFACLEEMAREHGNIFALKLGTLGNEPVPGIETNEYWVFLTRPHQIRLMYESDGSVTTGALANKVFFGTNEASVGYIDGEVHRRRRAQLHPMFNGSRDYSVLIQKVATQCFSEWPRETPVVLFPELQMMTSRIIAEVVCGNMNEDDREQLASMMPVTENARFTRNEVVAADRAIRAFIQERIDGYLEKSVVTGRDDAFGMLLKLKDVGDPSLSNEVIRDEVFGLLYTGFSTTSTTMSWILARVLTRPDVYTWLMRELRETIGDGPITRGMTNRMPNLDATIKETLRLHPVTPLNGVRMLKKPLEIDGYRLPAGTILVHCAYLLQRSPEVFFDPETFSPERFVSKRIDPYAWGAFGGGERVCIGRGFAMEEMKVLLAKMLIELKLELIGGLPASQQQGFFMAPANGLPCIIRA